MAAADAILKNNPATILPTTKAAEPQVRTRPYSMRPAPAPRDALNVRSTAKVSASVSGITTPGAQENRVTATKIGANPETKISVKARTVYEDQRGGENAEEIGRLVGPMRDERRRDDAQELRRREHEGDVAVVEAARAQPHREKRDLHAEHQECRGVEERQSPDRRRGRSRSERGVNPSPPPAGCTPSSHAPFSSRRCGCDAADRSGSAASRRHARSG